MGYILGEARGQQTLFSGGSREWAVEDIGFPGSKSVRWATTSVVDRMGQPLGTNKVASGAVFRPDATLTDP